MTQSKNTQLTHEQHRPCGVRYPLCLLAHNIEDATNVGSLFRLADALGIEAIYLTGSTPTPPDKKLHRTSRSTDTSVPFFVEQDPLDVIDSLVKQSYTVIGLELSIASVDVHDLHLEKDARVCLIIGSENLGVSQTLLDVCEHTVHIPMHGQNSSMNVAMACAIAADVIIREMDG